MGIVFIFLVYKKLGIRLAGVLLVIIKAGVPHQQNSSPL